MKTDLGVTLPAQGMKASVITPYGVSCPHCGGEHPSGTTVCPGEPTPYEVLERGLKEHNQGSNKKPHFMVPDL